MYAGRDFSPAEQAESQQYGFDFVNDLTKGESLTEATWALIVREGVDSAPGSHLVGLPLLLQPDGTGVTSATTQRISGLLPDVTYTVRAVVKTTAGNTLSLWAHIQGEPVE